MDDLDVKLNNIDEKMTAISDSINTLMYQLNLTKNTVNFLAEKLAEQKNQIASIDSSIASSTTMLYNLLDHVDKEQGSNYIKLEDLSQSMQGWKSSLQTLAILPSRVETLSNQLTILQSKIEDNTEILRAIDSLRATIDSQSDKSKGDKMITILTATNLLLQIGTLITRKEKANYNEMD